MKRILLCGLTGVLLLVLGAVVMSSASLYAQTNTSAKPATASGSLPNGKTLGSKSAPITIEVFSDFQCPACRAFYEMTMRQGMDNYVSAGKVYIVSESPFPARLRHAANSSRCKASASDHLPRPSSASP